MRPSLLLSLAAALCLSVTAPLALADGSASQSDYPGAALDIICSHSIGGDTDYNARLLAAGLKKHFNLEVSVTSLPGANGSLAMGQCRDAPADGYHLLATNSLALASNEASGLSDYGYEAFEVVCVFGRQRGENLLVPADAPYTDLEELIKASQERPHEIVMGVAMGGSSFIAGLILQTDRGSELALKDAGGDAAHRLRELLDGRIDATIAPYSLAARYIGSGQLRALCTLLPERLAAAPGIPTARESGVEKLAMTTYYVLLAPKGTPACILETLNRACRGIVTSDPEYLRRIEAYNFQKPYVLDIEESVACLKQQREDLMSYAPYLQ